MMDMMCAMGIMMLIGLIVLRYADSGARRRVD